MFNTNPALTAALTGLNHLKNKCAHLDLIRNSGCIFGEESERAQNEIDYQQTVIDVATEKATIETDYSITINS